jgi:hypothetical protein
MDQIRKVQPKRSEPQQQVSNQHKQYDEAPQRTARRASKRTMKIVIGSIIVLLILGAAAGALYYKKHDKLTGVNDGKYQALFLTNGQVYFGKLKRADSKTVEMNEIFYLQVQQKVQPKPEEPTDNNETQLIKLGGELHGPDDEMFIDRSQVLFWENLKDDSKVVQAISQYKK